MTLAQNLRSRARHRGQSRRELLQVVRRLEREADETACQLVAMATEIDELTALKTRLEEDFDRAAVDYSTALDDLRQAREDNTRLQAELANATAIRPGLVRPLWDAATAGLLTPATRPGRT